MKIIKIEKEEIEDRDQANFDIARKEINKKVGVPEECWLACGSGPWEFVWFEENLYSRCLGYEDCSSPHFKIHSDKLISYNDTNKEVLCQCGNTEFTLKYGCYEISAHCTKCGNDDIVYDG